MIDGSRSMGEGEEDVKDCKLQSVSLLWGMSSFAVGVAIAVSTCNCTRGYGIQKMC